MKRLLAITSIIALAACQQQASTSDNDATAAVDPLTITGGLLVTAPGGAQNLAVIRTDGTEYISSAGAMGTGKWSSKDGKICIDPDAEDGQTNCYSFSNVDEDGSYTATGDDGTTVKVLQVDHDNAPGTTPAHEAGAYLLTESDGTQGLVVHSKDGTYHEAPYAGKAMTRVADGKRCFDPEGDDPETCSSPGDVYADGSFTAIQADGTTAFIQPLLTS